MKNLKRLLFLFLTLAAAVWFLEISQKSPSPLAIVGEPPRLYSTQAGDSLAKTIVKSLESAKKSIVIMIYSCSDRSIIHAINQAADRGVDVRVIFDAKASADLPKKLSSKVHTISFQGKGLMHLKIIVIDDETVWLGSANLTKEGLYFQDNLMAEVISKEIAKPLLAKASNLSTLGRKHPISRESFLIQEQKIDLLLFPDDKNGGKEILSLIQGAKKTIKAALYTFTRKDFAEALVKAKERGVEVEVVIDKSAGEGAGKEVVSYLSKRGIFPRLTNGEHLMHNKMLWIDETILLQGSANWTRQAFHQNEEVVMILFDLTERQNQALSLIWNNLNPR